MMLKKTKATTSSKSSEHDYKARFLIDIFMFSTLINVIVCERNYFQSYETNHLMDNEVDNPSVRFASRKNETIYNDGDDAPLVTVRLDKMFHWIMDDGRFEKGGTSCRARSLKWGGGLQRFAGHRKRLQFALLPIMYKMGVMTTLLTGLTVLVLKGLTIGVILLIFAFGNYFTKLHKHGYQNTQPIHVHVHGGHGGKITSFPTYESGIAGPWDRTVEETNPTSFVDDDELDSYRTRLIQNSAASLKFKPLY